MIVHNAEATIKRCLDSMKDIVSEIIIAIDETTTDRTERVIADWKSDLRGLWPVVKTISIKSPIEIGFDEARNQSIAEACGDWILWLDDDEILVHPENIYKYLRVNGFHGYAIRQNHFTAEPLGVMKVDMPCRLFRNHRGVKFFGVVHEHPEVAINDGVGFVQLIPDMEIIHEGYTTENIRRGRFERNIGLLARDREKHPNRKLGKFLWFRDLAQMCRYEMEKNGGNVTPAMMERAKTGLKIWEELIEEKELRMVVDGMEFYDILSRINGGGFEFAFALDSSKLNGGTHLERVKPISANFASKEHVLKLFNALAEERVKDYERKYF
jgi:glycosyltransferase involved in cell wall biosynthesis